MSLSKEDHNILAERFKALSHPLKPLPTGTDPVLENLNGIKVITYDVYGTLFISGVGDIGIDDGASDEKLMTDSLLEAGIQNVRHQTGRRALELYNQIVEEVINELKREGIEYPEPDIRTIWMTVLEELSVNGLISGSIDELTAAKLAIEFESRMNPVWPAPQMVTTLENFKKKGVPQGIISNSQFYTPILMEALTGKTMTELGLLEELRHWSFEEKIKKPGLEFYRRFLTKVEKTDQTVQPENILYIGNDMLKDIYPAKTLGFKTALFAGDNRSLKWRENDEKCKSLKPDLVLTKLSQLTDCISSPG